MEEGELRVNVAVFIDGDFVVGVGVSECYVELLDAGPWGEVEVSEGAREVAVDAEGCGRVEDRTNIVVGGTTGAEEGGVGWIRWIDGYVDA